MKRDKTIVITGIGVLLIGVFMKPTYDRYIWKDHAETCESVRFYSCDHYKNYYEKECEGKNTLSYIRAFVKEFWEVNEEQITDISEDQFLVDGLCREGGILSYEINRESNELIVSCNVKGHDPEYRAGLLDGDIYY